MKKILIIGGSGYIGHVLTNYLLLKGFKVEVVDNLIYNQNNIGSYNFNNPKFIYHNSDLKNLFKNKKNNFYDSIVILAGLVGDPITKKYPKESKRINENDIQNIIKKIIKFKLCNKTIFISTCSNYGLNENEILNEESKLQPLSLYAKSKVKIEKFIINNFNNELFNPTILRFATAFGLSPRMRFDLTLNEFTRELYFKKSLDVYDADTWRPYCHVLDFARAITKIIKSNESVTKNQIYNVGSDQNNYTKRDIIKIISKYIPNTNINYLNKSFDRRNYKVNFSKIQKQLNFKPKYSLEYGVNEIINSFKDNYFKFNDPFQYGNYKINKYEK